MNKLVTVAVVTYNSANTLLGTLNSIYHQNYQNLELIISDDASTDNTIQVAEEWISTHSNRFRSCHIIVAKENKGTTYNVQQAVYGATGEWIKLMAADDFLLENGIDSYMQYVERQKDISVLEAKMIRIDGKGNYLDNTYFEQWRLRRYSQYKSAKEQYKQWVKRDVKLSPTIFFKVDSYKDMGGSDHFNPLIDDWTLVMKFLRNGYKVGFVDNYTTVYSKSVSLSHTTEDFFNKQHVKRAQNVKKVKCYPNISRRNLLFWIGECSDRMAQKIIISKLNNKRNIISKIVYISFSLLQYTNWQKMYVYITNYDETKRAKQIWKRNKEEIGKQ